MASVTPQQLRSALTKYFSLGEIRTLCFDLGIPFEDLGREGKSGKAESLVEYAERYDMFDKVVDYVKNARPHANLKGGMAPPVAQANQPEDKARATYNFYGPVTGSAIGKGSVQAENIAGGDITIHNYAEPTNKAEFAEQLEQVESLLKQAIANGEIKDDRDAKTAVEDIHDAIAEVKHGQPRSSRIGRRLEDVREILEIAGGIANTARKAGSAAIKALPIISGLIKTVQVIF